MLFRSEDQIEAKPKGRGNSKVRCCSRVFRCVAEGPGKRLQTRSFQYVLRFHLGFPVARVREQRCPEGHFGGVVIPNQPA